MSNIFFNTGNTASTPIPFIPDMPTMPGSVPYSVDMNTPYGVNTPSFANPNSFYNMQAAPQARQPSAGYSAHRKTVDKAASDNNIDSELIRAIIKVESNWNPNARSSVGAMGLMQLMPKTAQWLGVDDPYDPEQNIEGGSRYIASLIKRYNGDISKALMAYNCGAGNINRGRIPKVSKNYAKKVMSIYRSLQR